jgi:DNA gyrase subunit A
MGHKKRATTAPKRIRQPKGASKPPRPPRKPPAGGGNEGGRELDASLMAETRRRYLTYALSVITSRALPDVRDGLKPVQRRILYAMFNDEHLYPDAKHRKSAKVVGTVLGKYHPHGDTAVYDAMVRMAQDFSLRLPLVDGSGNFGSLDGDGAAAYRYTECRMAPPAMELLRELRQQVIDMRVNYDGTAEEPVVLPARLPSLLVNGTTGIAVGMATNIPPHNLSEVTKAAVALIDNRNLTTTNLLKHIQGPDFPTGGQILNSKIELRTIYETGQGAIRCRATYKTEARKRGSDLIIITSIPYAVTKATLVERIAELIINRKLPQLVDVRDESTTDVRIVLETKKDVNVDKILAYLFKHTPLQQNFNCNFTALIPTPNPEVGQPERMGVKEMLEHFVDFRFEVTTKRYEYELAQLQRRIHILKGFVTIFDALDALIKLIRASDGKKDASQKIIKKFGLDEIQTEAILELKLYKLAKLEINLIRQELKEKSTEAKRIRGILKSKSKLWGIIKSELTQVAAEFHTPRRTKTGATAVEIEFSAEDFIQDEDAHVVLTRDGWIKRMREVKDPKSTRVREGDSVMAVLPGSTKENVVFFTNFGAAYVARINDIPATTGYGSPAQKLFKFKDKERIVAAFSLDPRVKAPKELLAISGKGFGLRFAIDPHREPSTRSGRKFARPAKEDQIIDVVGVRAKDIVVVGTRKSHVLSCKASEINKLEGAGKGVTVIKTGADDQVIGFVAGTGRDDTLNMQTTTGTRKFSIAVDGRRLSARGGKGKQLVKRSTLKALPKDIEIIPLGEA